ncbi:KH domain-containing protein 3-like [Ochotona princeps]|uniref:KH domain-containing protein 3-like n=1 Tax=Ochotona princeps TaxID=9978 RepID=UPI002714ED16|nr:KH domain-containing protein 3-like [Ochotona princeps]
MKQLLQQRKGELSQVLGNLTKPPKWFHSEFLKSPKAVRLEAWLVEAIFGPGGEHIPHVECVSNTLLHVNQWDPEGDAEILICGRPYYQKDVSKLIMNLADYHRQLRLQSSKKAGRPQSPVEVHGVGAPPSPIHVGEASTRQSQTKVDEAGTQGPPQSVSRLITRL